MATRRKILESLTREALLAIAAQADVGGLSSQPKANVVQALVGTPKLTKQALLEALTRDQLKAACRHAGLDDSGREKAVLVNRLMGGQAQGASPGRGRSGSAGSGPPPAAEEGTMGRRRGSGRARRRRQTEVQDYRHETEKRKNNPPAKIAAEGTVPAVPKARYEYNPHLPPVLRFDQHGKADKLPELLAKATREPLTEDEANLLAAALRRHEPWLEWTGKREAKSFEVDPVALHIHERVSAQAILKVARRQDVQRSLFGDPEQAYHEAVQFYRHDVDWTNRLILGDSLEVMSSLAKRENLAGKVQMIYIDPPYGIKFASNFQPQVGNRDVKEREQDLTREPEMVKAFRDTWHLGIHSYLAYLRDRLVVARDLLADNGSVFVQISDDNLHIVRSVMDEVFGADNFCSVIPFSKTSGATPRLLATICDFLLWYARDKPKAKYHPIRERRPAITSPTERYVCVETQACEIIDLSLAQKSGVERLPEGRVLRLRPTDSQGETDDSKKPVNCHGRDFYPPRGRHWSVSSSGMPIAVRAGVIHPVGNTLTWKSYRDEFAYRELTNDWMDMKISGFGSQKRYIVETLPTVIERCMLMTTDAGDLVIDPTCGSGTTALVAEQWGRRWITVDTSRVAVAIARQELLTSQFRRYRVCGEDDDGNGNGDYRPGVDPHPGLVCKMVPHITLKSIAQNENLDPIFAKHEPILADRLEACNAALAKVSKRVRQICGQKLLLKEKGEGKRSITDADRRRWLLPPDNRGTAAERKDKQEDYTVDLEFAGWYDWEVPFDTDDDWLEQLQRAVKAYRKAWRAKMDEVNACIAANADQEELVDQPEVIKGVVRVSGPFTVEAVQPPELSLGEADYATLPNVEEGLFDGQPEELDATFEVRPVEQFAETRNIPAYLEKMIRLLKGDAVLFPGNREMRFTRLEAIFEENGVGLHAEGRWAPKGKEDTDPEGAANVCVVFGPQYGPVTAPQVEEGIRAANRAGYDQLVFAGFSFDGPAQATIEEAQHPKLKIHMAHVRPDVNPGMDGLLKEQPGSQLFTVFGQPRTTLEGPDKEGNYVVHMEGVDIYNPVTNEVVPTKAGKVAAWFLDGDYDGRTFCITQAFFPDRTAWKKLARALKGVVDEEKFDALSGTTSLPFPPGKHKRVAVKVIDPRGNEVMRVHRMD